MSADVLRQAYQALLVGDPEPLVSLMSDDMIWRARSPRWRFWRPVPQ